MNMRLLILSLIALLGLFSVEPAGVNADSSGKIPPGQQKQLIDQQHQALVQEEQTLAQADRQLLDQKRAFLEQLRALSPTTGTAQDWQDLWENYQKYTDADDDEDDFADIYKNKLKALRPTGLDKHAFKSKVEALLKALEGIKKQQDALAQSWDKHNQKVDQLNTDQLNFNQQNGQN